MWTPTAREQHDRKALRYQTDLTDAEWPMREIVNGIFYVMRAGCP